MHPEALSNKGKKLVLQLKNFDGFYLAGGTALALQIGHRMSVDFDFFSEKEIPSELFDKTKRVFSRHSLKFSVNDPSELTIFVDDIKVTFLHYSFPLVSELIDYKGIRLLSIQEIAATKAYTIGRRGSYKDYVDLYFVIAERYLSLDKIIELAEKKYGNEFNSRLFLEQLIYLEDIQDTEIIFLKNTVRRDKLESFFREKVGEIKL